MKAFDEVLATDKKYQELKKKSAQLAAKRGALRAGSTRARVTTANANWARAAEARDAREEYLRREWENQYAGVRGLFAVLGGIGEWEARAIDHMARECLRELAEEEQGFDYNCVMRGGGDDE